VNSWLVNGAAVQSGGATYTLGSVTANSTVRVTFIRIVEGPTRIVREAVASPGTGHRTRLIFTGLAGQLYRVEYANNLASRPVDWQLLGAAVADAQGEFQVVDPPPMPSQRFYRAVQPVTTAQVRMESLPLPATGRQARLVFPGAIGRSYRVQYTDNLGASPIVWQSLGTISADVSGEVRIADSGPLPTKRFYRSVELP
jgi:hypothetical protein